MSNPAATSSVRLLALTQPKPTPRSESFVQSLTLAGAVGDDIDEIRLVRPRTAFTPGRRRSSPQRPRRDRAGDATSKLADGTLLIDRVTSASPNRPRTRAEAPRQLVGGTASEPTLVPTAAAIAEAIARSRAAGLLLGEEGDEDGDDDDDAETCSDVDCEDDEEEQEISDFDDDQESEESTADIVAKLKRMELETPTSSGGDGDGEVSLEEVAVLLTSKAFVQPDVYVKSPITPSLFEDGDAVLYFPPENEAVRNLPKEFSKVLYWKICKFTPKVVRNALRRAGFKLVKGGKKWIGYWGKHFPVERFKLVQPWQKVNHFPMSFEIGRKDRMYVNVSRMRERAGAHTVDFLPQTFLLPHQRRNLKNQFNTSALWIVKPPASARGLGIRLAAKWTDVPRKREVVVSRYISNPYLIDGKKFDLRLYVAVTSFDPLRIYLFREGLVRFAADQYSSSTNTHNVKNRFAHLTNYSVSKKNKGGKPRFQANEPLSGKFNTSSSKWDLETLREYLALRSIDFGRVMESIKCLVVKTIISANTVNASGVRLCVPNSASCYELFGFDVLLDSDLKPWLMEVNISPSLKASCDMDYNLKSRMVTDLLNLVGIRIKDLEASRIKKYKDNWKRPGLSNKERSKHREHYRNKDYDCLGELSGDDIKILKETEDELSRRGNFECVFPVVGNISYLNQLFGSISYYDRLLQQWVLRHSEDPAMAVTILRGSPLTRYQLEHCLDPAFSNVPVSSITATPPASNRTSLSSPSRVARGGYARPSIAKPSQPKRTSKASSTSASTSQSSLPAAVPTDRRAPTFHPAIHDMKAYEYSGSSAATIPTPKLEPHATPPPTAFGMVHPSYAAARRVPNFLLATSSRNSVAAREPLQAPALPQFDGLLVTKPVKINFNEEGTFRGPDPGTVAEIARGAARLRSIHHAFSTMRRSRREVMMDVVMMGGQQGGAEYPALQVQPEASLRYIDSAGEARTVGVLDAGGIMTMVDDGAAYGYDDGRGSVSGRSNVAEFYSELGEEREMDGAVVPPLFPSWGKPDWSGRRRKEAHVKKEERAVVAVSRAATKVASPLAVGVDEGRMSPWAPWVQPVPALMGRR